MPLYSKALKSIRRFTGTTAHRPMLAAALVPEDFRFSVKLPREITHIRKLKGVDEAIQTFLSEILPLRPKLGPLLCQLPPSLAFNGDDVCAVFDELRAAHTGPIALEARHRSWASDAAVDLLEHHSIDRVLADPAIVWRACDFHHPPRYVRLHSRPRVYYSTYTDEEIRSFRELLGADSWCVFDNTASGAACENALAMLGEL